MSKKPDHHKWTLDEFINSARDHIGNLLDNMAPRDLIYIASWAAGVFLLYQGQTFLEQPLAPFNIIYDPRSFDDVKKQHPSWIPLPLGYWKTTTSDNIAVEEGSIDWNKLAIAMVGSYALLKIDVSDVTSALTKVTAAIKA